MFNNIIGSVETARRRLHESGLSNHIAAQTEMLTEAQRLARVAWCVQHQDIPDHVWRHLCVSDEKVVCSTSDAQRLVYRPPLMRHHPDYVVKNKRSGRFSAAFWCWASGEGVGGAHYVPRRMDSVLYCDVLEHRFLPQVRERYPDRIIEFVQVS